MDCRKIWCNHVFLTLSSLMILIANISANYYVDTKCNAINENISKLESRIVETEGMIKDMITMSSSNRIDIESIRKYSERDIKSKFSAIRSDLDSIKSQLGEMRNLDKFDRRLESMKKSVENIEDTMDNEK